ncbi:MAG: GspE/PulE family protein [Spirochaetales bacterium]|nr:GspE/PulE family protein [Spirochaetales bacterium]
MTSLKEWFPLPEEEQFSPDYIKQQGTVVLKVEGLHYTLGITADSQLLKTRLKNHLPGKKLTFLPIDSRELSIFLADKYSVGEGAALSDRGETLDIEKLEGDAPMINLVNSLILEALNLRASDIHIEAFSQEVAVRFRIDGVLKKIRSVPREHFNALSSRIKIMANLNIMERRLPQDGRISVETGGESVDLRVSIVPIAREGESIVLRLLNRSGSQKNLEDMGFSGDQIGQLRRLIKNPHGLILVTGPTGSGKTTTLNGLLREMASEEKKIITIEDPIEFVIDGIDQIQTNADIGLTFSTLLRRVLRQDPNIIMVGEIRDSETAELAVRAALTGHLVLSTLHTNDAVSAIPRLTDMGVEPYLLASVLKGVLAQRLVRRLCPSCKETAPVQASEKKVYESYGLTPPGFLYHPKGCEECSETGFTGRKALGELLMLTPELEGMISRGCDASELKETLEKGGYDSLIIQGLNYAAAGETTLREVEGAVYL